MHLLYVFGCIILIKKRYYFYCMLSYIMATRMEFQEFPLKWPEAKNYFVRFEYYLLAQGITNEEMKKAAFISYCGEEAFQMVVTLLSPLGVDDTSVTYDKMKEELTNHLKPKIVKHYERYKFYNIKQGSDTASAYLLKLKEQSNRCEFDSLRDDLLLTQYICGLANESLRNKLLVMNNISLDDAIQHSLVAEEVSRVKPALNEVKSALNQFTQNAIVTAVTHNLVNCQYCGRKHRYGKRFCPAVEQRCNNCNKIGHFKAVCKMSKKENHSVKCAPGR